MAGQLHVVAIAVQTQDPVGSWRCGLGLTRVSRQQAQHQGAQQAAEGGAEPVRIAVEKSCHAIIMDKKNRVRQRSGSGPDVA
ncbi:MAG: hypothetical protein HOC74_04595 [Gemmatimonadetes bacterium]|nr:hypothetical protein [Gemmatimonadota bacterium]